MGNCFSSPKVTDSQDHPEADTQSRKADGSDITPVLTSTSAGFFTGAQNMAVTGQFLEVHGNYVCHVCHCTIHQ